MKKILNTILLVVIVASLASCNDEWKDELYAHYVSFKAPINSKGVTDIYVRYKKDSISTYQLPLIVSGTTTNPKDMNIKVALDPDTLRILNYERFQHREDLYFIQLESSYYNIPSYSVNIPADSRQGLLPIDFTFKDIDMFHKWLLPLTIVEEPSANYQVHPRKNYKKAMLRVIPFNDYSGVYQATAMKLYPKGSDINALVVSTRPSFVVNDKSIFFYAGTIDEESIYRKTYKIIATFKDDGELDLKAENDEINFEVIGTPRYTVEEEMDDLLPYLKHRYITLNLSYSYDDVTSVPGVSIGYEAKGSMTLERKINTQIPFEDQAIEW